MLITTDNAGFDIRNPEYTRSSGVHLSGIVRRMALDAGVLKPDTGPSMKDLIDNTPPEIAGKVSALCRLVVGMAWEDWIAPRTKEVIHQPGELERDGICGTPDGFEFDGQGLVIHEFKATYKSLNQGIEKQWMWLSQTMGYAAMASEQFGEPVLRARLHVMWLMGDYSFGPGSGPCYRIYNLTFTQEELERLWTEILENKHQAIPEDWE